MPSILNKKKFNKQASYNYTAKFFRKKSSVCILVNGSLRYWLPTDIHEYLNDISSEPMRLLSLLEIINQHHSSYHVRIADLYSVLRFSKNSFNESVFELLTMDSEFVIQKILETQEFLSSIKTEIRQ